MLLELHHMEEGRFDWHLASMAAYIVHRKGVDVKTFLI